MAAFSQGPMTTPELKEAAAGEALLELWLLTKALLALDVVICSLDGRIFRLAPLFVFHEDQIGNQEFRWPLPKGTKLHHVLEEIIRSEPEIPYLNRFRFLDLITCTVSASPSRLERLKEYGLKIDEDVDPQCRIVANFDGWALCVPEGNAPANTDELWDLLGLEPDANGTLPGGRRARGRPGLQALAREIYYRLFPDGHRGQAWKEVQKAISDDAGRTISAKTIQRAIGQDLGHNGQNSPSESS
jgi:hypothetical protein